MLEIGIIVEIGPAGGAAVLARDAANQVDGYVDLLGPMPSARPKASRPRKKAWRCEIACGLATRSHRPPRPSHHLGLAMRVFLRWRCIVLFRTSIGRRSRRRSFMTPSDLIY